MMKKATRGFYLVIFILTALYVFLAYYYGQKQTQYYDLGAEIKQIYPTSMQMLDDTTVKYTIDIDDASSTSRAVSFFSSHEMVYMYCDGQLAYERMSTPSVFGGNPGSAINLIVMPSDVKQIEIVFKDFYPEQVGNEHIFYYGNGQLLMNNYIVRSLPTVLISLFIMLIGFIMVGFWAISLRSSLVALPAAFYFGVFTILLGLWNINETEMALILMQDRKAASLFGYVLLLIMVYPCVQFAREYLDREESKSFYITTWASFIGLLALELLQIFQITDFIKTAIVFHLLLMLGFAYIIYIAVYQARRGLKASKVQAILIAAIALAFSAGVNFIAYYKGWGQTGLFSKLGMLIFIATLGIETMTDSFAQINEGKKADIYKNMAYTDSMTGLYNRTAFEMWEKDTNDYSNTEIVTFDLNNLKLCNDSMGHAAGDLYITSAANMIKNIFERLGRCYRIGGDEFCVIINKNHRQPIEYYIKKFRALEERLNYKNTELEIAIAVGYAKYDANDGDFEVTRSRADEIMYNNKKELKNSDK